MKTLLKKLARKDGVRMKKLIPPCVMKRGLWWTDLLKIGPFPKNMGDSK